MNSMFECNLPPYLAHNLEAWKTGVEAVFERIEALHSYRNRMRIARPGHVWESLPDDMFMFRLGAMARDKSGKLRPTRAGLLMFGFEHEIIREFPVYFLDYQEKFDADTRWTDRIYSSSGDWNGGIYDFYFRVYNSAAPKKLDIGGEKLDFGIPSVTPPVTPPATPPVDGLVIRLIVALKTGEKGNAELLRAIGIRDRARLRKRYLKVALEKGFIEMTEPDSPHSPNQKYKLTPLGFNLAAEMSRAGRSSL